MKEYFKSLIKKTVSEIKNAKNTSGTKRFINPTKMVCVPSCTDASKGIHYEVIAVIGNNGCRGCYFDRKGLECPSVDCDKIIIDGKEHDISWVKL